MDARRLVLRVAYGSAYVLLHLVLVGLLLVTPSDAIGRSIHNAQNYNVWIVAVAAVAAVAVVGFVYAFRLYSNKTALASIPKAWVPFGKGDVDNAVHRMVAAGLDRSAAVARRAQPSVDAAAPGWGAIEHDGWTSPLAPDVPNLHHDTVVLELPNLIEGKALALALAVDPRAADPDAAALLQRPPAMSLRGYMNRLADLGAVPADGTTAAFVVQYEHARFSDRPVTGARFRELMRLFAEVLRAMRPVGPAACAPSTESDIDNDAPADTDPPSPSSAGPRSRASSSSDAGSVVRLATRGGD